MKNKYMMKTAFFTAFVFILAMFGTYAAAEAEGGFFVYQFSERYNGAENTYAPYKVKYTDIAQLGAKKTAADVAAYLDKMPQGKRCVDLNYISRYFGDSGEIEDYLWWDVPVQKIKLAVDMLFEELKVQNVEIDCIIDDYEHGMSNWVVGSWEAVNKIQANPKYKSEIRPLLVEDGYPFSDDERSELYYIVDISKHETAYLKWNTIMERRCYEYYKEAIIDPIKKYYPDVPTSNYGYSAVGGVNKFYDSARHKIYLGGASETPCTHCSPVMYGSLAHISFKGRTPEGYPFEQFHKTGYNCLVYDIIKPQEGIMASDKGIMPWIALNTADGTLYTGNAYYDELIFHNGMLNADPFLSFNHAPTDDLTKEGEIYLGNLVSELNELVGTGKRKTLLKDRMSYNTRYVLNGIETEDKCIWRITPDLYTPGISKENFLIKTEPITFQIGCQVAIFPEGSYIVERAKDEDYGYWVVSPKGTRPTELVDESLTPAPEPVPTDDNIPGGAKIPYTYVKYTGNKNISENKEDNKQEDNIAENNVKDEPSVTAHWAAKALESALETGLIKGTEKGVEPDRTVTKAEFCTMAARAMGMEIPQIEGEWYDGTAQLAYECGWIDDKNNMDGDMSRAMAADVTARMLGLANIGISAAFTDINEINPQKIVSSVNSCAALGIITGYPDGSFKPLETVTRAEAVVIIQRAVK